MLYASLLEACGAASQAGEVLRNLTREHSCGYEDIQAHLALVGLQRRCGETSKCLDMYDDAVAIFSRTDGIYQQASAAERSMVRYALVCAKAEFMCDVYPGSPQAAVEYIYDVLHRTRDAFRSSEILLVVRCAYKLLCKFPYGKDRDDKVWYERYGSLLLSVFIAPAQSDHRAAMRRPAETGPAAWQLP